MFNTVSQVTLPAEALLQRYAPAPSETTIERHTDCYSITISRSVALAEFVEAFYTSAAFKPERALLGVSHRFRADDDKAQQLARAEITQFSAWRVETRTPDQLLLADAGGRTRSWLMVSETDSGSTRLLFGSAVLPVLNNKTSQYELGTLFRALLGVHQWYSRLLLTSAAKQLARTGKSSVNNRVDST